MSVIKGTHAGWDRQPTDGKLDESEAVHAVRFGLHAPTPDQETEIRKLVQASDDAIDEEEWSEFDKEVGRIMGVDGTTEEPKPTIPTEVLQGAIDKLKAHLKEMDAATPDPMGESSPLSDIFRGEPHYGTEPYYGIKIGQENGALGGPELIEVVLEEEGGYRADSETVRNEVLKFFQEQGLGDLPVRIRELTLSDGPHLFEDLSEIG
jgi:hypothetical protein